MRPSVRKLHRYLGLFTGFQMLFWMIGGLYFSWNALEKVRGEDLVVEKSALFLESPNYLSPSRVVAEWVQMHPEVEVIDRMTLRFFLDEPVYEIRYREAGRLHYALADALSGAIRSPIGKEEALAVARADFKILVPVRSVARIEALEPGSEYRGRALPAWRIAFEHPTGSRVYVSAERGIVTARRNDTWRVFDYLWMLHIMDYEGRENFNNRLLQGMSILGVVTVLSGFLLWGTSTPLFCRLMRKRRGSMMRS